MIDRSIIIRNGTLHKNIVAKAGLYSYIYKIVFFERSVAVIRTSLILIFTFISILAFAQTPRLESLNKKIQDCITIDIKNINDSTAFYSLAIRIEIRKTKNRTIVNNLALNDSIGNVLIKNYEGLKKLDYSSLVPLGKSILIIPISVFVINNKKIYDHSILFKMLVPRINKLFDYDPIKKTDLKSYIYMSPLLISIDNTIYD